MTLALKVIVLFTIGMGTLFLKSVIFIYGWMPAHMAAVAIFLVNITPMLYNLYPNRFLPCSEQSDQAIIAQSAGMILLLVFNYLAFRMRPSGPTSLSIIW